MNEVLHLDVETRSIADLKDVGAYKYFDDSSTDLWCAAYSFGEEEPKIWVPGETCPADIAHHVLEGGVVAAWNASFEKLAWKQLLIKKYGWPPIHAEQWRCSMAEALAMNLPGMLSKAAPALGLDITKDEKGNRLMLQMCRPRKLEPLEWWDDASRKERLAGYCKQDVRTEVAIGKRLMRLRPSEVDVFKLDAKINDRGVYIDEKLCIAAQKIVEKSTIKLTKEMQDVTGKDVASCSATAQLVRYLNANGVVTDSVDKEHIEDLLIRDDLPADCRRALELRQCGSKVSVSKIDSMLQRRQADGRARGNIQYHGAGPGRWTARGIQMHNLMRPIDMKNDDPAELTRMVDNAINIIQEGNIDNIEAIYGNPMNLVADCVRPMICAAPGNTLFASDFSNIEGRGVAWQAGQEDKLDAFRAFDAKTGPDLYLVTAAAVYSCGVKDAKPHRQIGKVSELALGFEGGAGAFAKMSKTYGVRIADLYDGIWECTDIETRDKALYGWNKRGKKLGIKKEGYLAAEVIKLKWRTKNDKIVQHWRDLKEGAIRAVENSDKIVKVGYVRYRKAGSFLFCQLPSGRAICYPYPKVYEVETEWGTTDKQLAYKFQNPITRQWSEDRIWGGVQMQNNTEAICRDIMCEAMLRIEAAGYEVILTVHDEVVAEVPDGFGSMEEYNSLMVQQPTWASGFPITASGWTGARYRK